MVTKSTLPPGTVPIHKEDLFYALLRLFQLTSDIDPSGDDDADEEELSPEVIAALEEELEAEAEEPEPNAGTPPPPDHFQKFYASLDDMIASTTDEYLSLFALLCTPLDKDPALKEEFLAYASARGVHMEFVVEKKPPNAPKLVLVPPQKNTTDDDDKKPPVK